MSESGRQLVYELFQLSYPTCMRLLSRLDLLRDEDQGQPDSELILRVIQRARAQGLLPRLAAGIRASPSTRSGESW
jgi:hypothetical protein